MMRTEMFRNILGVSPLIYKKYINYIFKMDINNIDTINKKIIEIDMLFAKIYKYQSNRKPRNIVKKLSLYSREAFKEYNDYK